MLYGKRALEDMEKEVRRINDWRWCSIRVFIRNI
jgi:hypothetical protein